MSLYKRIQDTPTKEPEVVAESKFSIKICNFEGERQTVETAKTLIPEIDSYWWLSFQPSSNGIGNPNRYFNYVRAKFNLESKVDEIWQSMKYSYGVQITSGGILLSSASNQSISHKVTGFTIELYRNLIKLPSYGTYLDSEGSLLLDIKVTVKCTGNILNQNTVHDRILVRQKVTRKIGALLNDPLFSDFTIKVKENKFKIKEKEFKVHRSILAASSPVFRKMFETDMIESKTNSCEVDKIDIDIFDHLLRFIYTGDLPENLIDVATSLYEAADYYQIDILKTFCQKELHVELTSGNAPDIYEWVFFDSENNLLKTKAWETIKRDIMNVNEDLPNEPWSPQKVQQFIAAKETFKSAFEALKLQEN